MNPLQQKQTDRIVDFFCYISVEDSEQALTALMKICEDAYLDGLAERQKLYPNGNLDYNRLLKMAKKVKRSKNLDF